MFGAGRIYTRVLSAEEHGGATMNGPSFLVGKFWLSL